MSVAICGGSPGYGRSALGVSHGRQQGDFGVPGIEPRMLDNYWNVGFEHGGVIRISGDLLRVGEIVEAQMQGSPRRDRDAEWPDRLPVGKEDCDCDMRIAPCCIENTRGLVRDERG